MLYFGYGSNMCTGRLRARVSSAEPLGKFSLKGYRFRFNKRSNDGSGKGNVEHTGVDADVVWGVLFEFDASQKLALDDAEVGYDELMVDVECEADRKTGVYIYIAHNSIDNSLQPYSWYKRFVMEGARQHGLPPAYVKFLDAFPESEDPDRARDKKKRAITC
jgi:AIG2-like family